MFDQVSISSGYASFRCSRLGRFSARDQVMSLWLEGMECRLHHHQLRLTQINIKNLLAKAAIHFQSTVQKSRR
jgi:hypothetical protein